MESGIGLHGSSSDPLMSALECADQASPRACTVKAPHIAALTTKAFFRKCQMSVASDSQMAPQSPANEPRCVFRLRLPLLCPRRAAVRGTGLCRHRREAAMTKPKLESESGPA